MAISVRALPGQQLAGEEASLRASRLLLPMPAEETLVPPACVALQTGGQPEEVAVYGVVTRVTGEVDDPACALAATRPSQLPALVVAGRCARSGRDL